MSKKRIPPPERIDPLQRYSLDEASALLRQSLATTYAQLKRGELRVIRSGSRTYVPGSEIARHSTLPAT